MVKNDTSHNTDWRLFRGRLFIASLAMAAGVAMLGAVHQWPMWTSHVLLPTLIVAAFGGAFWSAFPVRGPSAVLWFVVALIVLAAAFLVGVIGLFYVACATGHCISFG